MLRAHRIYPLARCVVALACLCFTGVACEAALRFEARGRYLVENHTDREFQGHNQMWEGVQDARGILYFGNLECLQEYDGDEFRRVELTGASFVIETALAADGTIWIGGVDDIGYVKTNPDGQMELVGLRDQLPEADRDYGFINAVEVTDEGVYFGSGYRVFFWNGSDFTTWQWSREERAAAHLLFVLDGVPYLFSEGSDPLRLENGEWVTVPVDPELREQRVVDVVSESDGSLLLATSADGLWRLRDGSAERVPTEADEFLRTSSTKRMLRLRDGALLVGTARRGAVILRRDGSVEMFLDASAGLKNETVNAMLEDREGGLWISTNIGVSHVQRSAFTVFGPQDGLPDMAIFQTFEHNGTVHLTSDRGMYRMVPPSAPGVRPRFEPVPGVPESNSDHFVHHGLLYAVTKDGLVEIGADGTPTIVLEFKARATPKTCKPSLLHEDVVFYGTGEGLNLLRWIGGAWSDEGPIAGFRGNTLNFTEANDGSLWVATMSTGLFRFRPPDGIWRTDTVQIDAFPPGTAGLPDVQDFTVTWRMPDGTPCMGTAAGLFVWNPEAGRFESSDRFSPMLTDPDIAVVTGAVDPDGVLWAVLENYEDVPPWGFGEAGRVVDGVWLPFPARIFAPSSIVQGFTFIDEPVGRTAWSGSPNGLVRVETALLDDEVPVPPPARIRLVETLRGERVHSDGATAGSGIEQTVDYARRNLRFVIAAPFFGAARSILYQTRLDGFEDEWSEPTIEYRREITNLAEGNYRFRARAIDVDGRTGPEAVLAFRVLPPWYRSIAAYGGYLVFAGIGVFSLVRWRGAALRRRNEQLEQIVEERTGELRIARDEADRANKAKSTFLANMSHELRTPLNGILGYAQILKRSPTVQSEDRRRIEVLQSSGEHLLRLINEVLDLSKIEADRLELHAAASDIRSVVSAVAETFRPRVEDKGLRFELEIEPAVPQRVMVDEQKLGQVLFNLVGNAVKFTTSGSVAVRVKTVDGALTRFEVVDTGAGIPREAQASIFEPFRQLESTGAIRDGTGLGLTICSRIVALMGGRLQVESAVGRGSRFWFEVPLPAVSLKGGASGERQEYVISGYEGARRRVLVVDDVAINRNIVSEMLEPLGFSVDLAASGEAALAIVKKARPDLVLMDLRMAPMSGAEVVKRMRADETLRGVRIVSFSASAMGFTREDAFALGCDDHLPKPFREEELFDVLERQLGLTWIRTIAEEKVTAAGERAIPTPHQVERLLACARRGDAAGLRQTVRELNEADPSLAGFLGEIEALAARYQMREIRSRLEALGGRL